MTVTITAPPAAPASPAAALSAGGSLVAGTTYYYRVAALVQITAGAITGPYGAKLWGIPSDEVSATPDADNKTITVSWDAVAGATGYIVYRTTTSDDYDPNDNHYMQNPAQSRMDYYASATGTSYVDNGARTLGKSYYFTNGIPLATIEDSTEGSPDTEDTLYTALVDAGLTDHCLKFGDLGLGTDFVYRFRCIIDIAAGWWKIQKGKTVFHEGALYFTTDDGGWTMGEKTGTTPYRGVQYIRSFVYHDNTARTDSTIKIYASALRDNSRNSYGVGNNTIANWQLVFNGKLIIENSIIQVAEWQIGGSATGSIINSIISDSQSWLQSSGAVYMSGVQYCKQFYGIYAYYATQNPVMKSTVIKGIDTSDIYFHKNTTAVSLDAINHQWKTDPPTATAGTRPTYLTVRRKRECNLTFVDKDGTALSGVAVTIVDNLANTITPEVSDSDGKSWITSGTASAGAASTLTDSSKTWGVNALNDLIVEIYDGTGEGQERSILSNTATIITIKGTWDTNPDATSKYRLKMHLMSHAYLGNAVSPYYTTITYGPFVLTASKAGKETLTYEFSLTSILQGDGTYKDEPIDWHLELQDAVQFDTDGERYYSNNADVRLIPL